MSAQRPSEACAACDDSGVMVLRREGDVTAVRCTHCTKGQRPNEATITVADADDVLDALAASIADGEIEYDDIKGPIGAKRAALELLRQVRIGLAIDPASNRLRNEPAPIGLVTCINCGRSSGDPTGSACPSGGGPQHDWEERDPDDEHRPDEAREPVYIRDPSGSGMLARIDPRPEPVAGCPSCGAHASTTLPGYTATAHAVGCHLAYDAYEGREKAQRTNEACHHGTPYPKACPYGRVNCDRVPCDEHRPEKR